MIDHCGTCKPGPAADFQDATYGVGNRVFNLMKKADKGSQEGRCTVCSRVKVVKEVEAK